MRKPHFKNKAARGAFTLIEILVVLVIMGFLVSLVAPKLGGIVDSAVDTNCDTNQERLRKVLNTYVSQNNALPSGLMNMVVVNTDATRGKIPNASDGDKANGAEILSDEFTGRFLPQVHYINSDEAEELVGMGVKGFKYIGKTDEATTVDPADDKLVEEGVSGSMAAGVPVMMAGVGFNDATDSSVVKWSTSPITIAVAGSAVTQSTANIDVAAATAGNANTDGSFARMDEAKSIGRILMGVANSGELVQSGLLDESGTCPGQLQNEDQFSWGNYVVVLPRLDATMSRLLDRDGDGTPAAGDLATHADTEAPMMHTIALGVDTGESATGDTIVGRTPGTGYKYFAAQEVKDQTTSCPEGHTWGANADSYAVRVQLQ